jgi:hypothetical protein
VRELVRDATELARGVDVRALAPLAPRRWLWLAPLLLVSAGGLNALGPIQGATELVRSTTSETLEVTAARVERVAELLRDDSTASTDPYLRAVGEAFRGFGERLREGALDVAEVEEELARLLAQLAQAAEASDAGLARALAPLSRSRDGGESSQASPDGVGATGEAVAVNDAPAASQGEDDEVELPPRPRDDVADVFRTLGAVLDELEDRAGPNVPMVADARPQQVPVAGSEPQGYLDRSAVIGDEREALLSALRAQADAGGVPVGAAQESTDRAGDAAGGGTQTQDGPEATPEPSTSFEREAVALPRTEADGRRVQLELEPEARRSEVATDETLGSDGFRRTSESSSSREVVGVDFRSVVIGYFLPGGVEPPELGR